MLLVSRCVVMYTDHGVACRWACAEYAPGTRGIHNVSRVKFEKLLYVLDRSHTRWQV